MNNRVQRLDMDINELIRVLSKEGVSYNPEAMRVLMKLYGSTPTVDPDNALGGLGSMLMLDMFGVYGSHIWILYKDICGEQTDRMVGLLRAIQLGFYHEMPLHISIKQCEDGIHPTLNSSELDTLIIKVRERLPNFKG